MLVLGFINPVTEVFKIERIFTMPKVEMNSTEVMWLIIQMVHDFFSNKEFQYYDIKIIFMINKEADFSTYFM